MPITTTRCSSTEELAIVRNLMELYLHDFSEFDGAELDDSGRYHYPWLEEYWSAADCSAHIIRVDGRLAGFALVDGEVLLPESRRAIGEFFVLKKYRKSGVGRQAACQLFDGFRGPWEVAQIAANRPAQAFWRSVVARYSAGRYREVLLDNDDWSGPLQCFDSAHWPA